MRPLSRTQPETTGARYRDVGELLAAAREGLRRLAPREAAAAQRAGDIIVDTRPAWQRAVEGEIVGSLIVERNHLEWRLDPFSGAQVPQARAGQRWIVVCSEGYSSSLAAASLRAIGVDATDMIGGVRQWVLDGLPVVAGLTAVEAIVAQPE